MDQALKQRIYTTAARHLLKQGKRSETRDTFGMPRCMYRGPEGTKCAIGACITDEHYTPELENLTVYEPQVLAALAASLGVPQSDLVGDVNFLARLQGIHDFERIANWPVELAELATQHRLTDAT